MSDKIILKVPASPQFVQVVRLVAAGLAAGLKFTLEDIDDLKTAVDELSAYVTGPHGRDGTLELTFLVNEDRIEVEGVGRISTAHKVRTELTEFSQVILDTVADAASLDHIEGTPTFKLLKSKSSGVSQWSVR